MSSGNFVSMHGRVVGYNANGILFNGRLIGGSTPTALGRGNTYYVDSNVGASDGTSPSSALATIKAALAKCTPNQGDTIVVLPGHAETISATATDLAFNVAGVSIIGLGVGSKRPTLTFSATASTITVSAPDVSVQGILFVPSIAAVVSAFTVTTTSTDLTVDGNEFRDSGTSTFLAIVTTGSTANSADGLTITNNKVLQVSASATAPVILASTHNRLTIADNFITRTAAVNNVSALLEHGALVVTDGLVARNYIYSVNTDTATGAILVKTTATTGSGLAISNRVRALDVAAAIMITAAAVQWGAFDNLYTGDTAFSGFVLPAIATD